MLKVNVRLQPLEEWINAEHAKLSWPRRLEYNVEAGSAALILKKCENKRELNSGCRAFPGGLKWSNIQACPRLKHVKDKVEL